MKIGIIGAGNVAKTLAKLILRSGKEVILSNSRGTESLGELVTELGKGAYAGTVLEAAKQEVVILAVWWDNIENALSGITDWNNRILIDATNQLSAKGGNPHIVETAPLTGSEVVAGYAKGAKVIKAFNALFGQYMNGTTEKGRRVLFYAGDNTEAKITIAAGGLGVSDKAILARQSVDMISVGKAALRIQTGQKTICNEIER